MFCTSYIWKLVTVCFYAQQIIYQKTNYTQHCRFEYGFTPSMNEYDAWSTPTSGWVLHCFTWYCCPYLHISDILTIFKWIQSYLSSYTLLLYCNMHTSKYNKSFCWAFLRSSSEPNLVPHVIQHHTWPHLSCLGFILQEKDRNHLLRECMAKPGFKCKVSIRLSVSFQRIRDESFHKILEMNK